MNLDHLQKNTGFTLIEMLVSIGIFLVIVSLGMTAVINIININKKSQSSSLVMSNLSLVIEAMSKNLRLGQNFSQPDQYSISFTPIPDTGFTSLTYSYDATNNAIDRTETDSAGNTYTAAITAPEVVIKNATFRLTSSGSGTTPQPEIQIFIQGYAGDKNKPELGSEFYLQSTVSQRLLNI